MGDAVALASRLRPAWPCIHEMSLWLARRLPGGADAVTGMNKGGTVEVGRARGDDDRPPTTRPATGTRTAACRSTSASRPGSCVTMENGFRIYHAGDTAVFSDMRLIGELYRPHIALLPIGGHFTMGPREAALAVELLGVKHVLPIHYGTFPILAGTPDQLRTELAARGLGDVEVHALAPGRQLARARAGAREDAVARARATPGQRTGRRAGA